MMGRATWLRLVLRRWLDNSTELPTTAGTNIDWLRVLPFIAMHLACIGIFWVGSSSFAVTLAIVLYLLRMFAITGFYHRYFSHKTFKTSRWFQCVMAVWAATAVQRGPLWWASMHRQHHVHSDQADDAHSPLHRGFLWSHMGWFLSYAHFATDTSRVQDLMKFPELCFLDRFDSVVPIIFAFALFGLGQWLDAANPGLHVSGLQLLVWGFCISTVAVYHGTFSVNSLCHVWGWRRYRTSDQSRNNPLIAVLTLGEGWHNNHHHHPGSACQGFYWWEFDPTYYGLRLLQFCGLIWDVKTISSDMLNRRRTESAHFQIRDSGT